MATLNETDEWVAGVYQIEETDPVLGGAPNEATKAGLDNIPHLHLAKRTTWLKARVDALIGLVVQASTTVAGIVQLSASVNSASTSTAATSSAVKAANDNANSRALASRTISAGGLATGGGDLTANRTITVPVATQAEAQAGTDNDKAMTPLRVMQLLAAQIGEGSASVAGLLRISNSLFNDDPNVAVSAAAAMRANANANSRALASQTISAGGLATGGGDLSADRTITVPAATQAEAQAATDNTKAMTPLRVMQLLAAQIGSLIGAASTSTAGVVRLSASVNSTSTSTAATSSAVKAANDNANARAPASRTISAGGLATGGGDLTANRTITVPAATQSEAQAGTDNTKAMTPLRVMQSLMRSTLGWGQSWTNPSRSLGAWYQNTTGQPIMVMIRSDKPHRIRLGASTASYVVAGTDNNDMTETDVTVVVPDGHYYQVETGQEFDQATWLELR